MQKNNYCLLCLKGKYFIINYLQEEILSNKRFELISKCRRENKNMLVFANICFCFVLFCFAVVVFVLFCCFLFYMNSLVGY